MTAGADRLSGPYPIDLRDISALNEMFSEAFSERYRRDGMVGVRVPPLNPAIWRFAIACAGAGAMLWRDGSGEIAAFTLAHASGREGWMGPLAVRDGLQGRGIGGIIVSAGIEALRAAGCTTIGLETMPRTVDNIGFYGSLGFVPAPLTITLTVDLATAGSSPMLLGHTTADARAPIAAACAALTDRVRPGADYTKEIVMTLQHGIGDVILLHRDDGSLGGFALYHDVPLVEGRSREELRVLKMVVEDAADVMPLITLVRAQARRSGAMRAAVRVQGEFPEVFRTMIAHGARVRWTDLRMVLRGAEEPPAAGALALSNWEI